MTLRASAKRVIISRQNWRIAQNQKHQFWREIITRFADARRVIQSRFPSPPDAEDFDLRRWCQLGDLIVMNRTQTVNVSYSMETAVTLIPF